MLNFPNAIKARDEHRCGLTAGPCQDLFLCMLCITRAVNEVISGTISMQAKLCCTLCLVELEPSFVQDKLAIYGAVAASPR